MPTSPQVRGFNALIARNGEVVTFRGASVRVLVNRLPLRTNPPGMQDVSTLDGSTIQLAATLTEPAPGETIADSKSYTHAIQKVKYLGHCWQCECEVTR